VKLQDGHLRLSASDVSNYLACRYLTELDRLVAERRLRPDTPFDVGFQHLVARGERHEAGVLAQFRADGLQVVEIPAGDEDEAAAATRDAVCDGAQVIYQGVLRCGSSNGGPALLGRPDFLIRADVVPRPVGDDVTPEGHEVLDAKLARSAKARAVLQSAFYSQLLAELQGPEPRWMHLALGAGDVSSFRFADVGAYERRIRTLLGELIAACPPGVPPAWPYPEPVEHCVICRWRANCAARRRQDDDLSLIAGMPANQRAALKSIGVGTRRGFAALDPIPALDRCNPGSLERSQLQARLQVGSEDARRIDYELLEPERAETGALVPNRGLLGLPEPMTGDLFFDIEGARYYSEDGREFGLQYLFGVVDTADLDGEGRPGYTEIWAFDRGGEKLAFERLIDFITARRAANPGLHVYHYNHYEPTSIDHLTALHETREEAVGRLMGRFQTCEDSVDDLFRLGVFVDLYRIVRQGIRAGVESYSIKQLEPLVGYRRLVDLGGATSHLIAFEAALDEGRGAQQSEDRRVVAAYNEDDCRASLALRDWLERQRLELARAVGSRLPRPVVARRARASTDPILTRVKHELLENVPDDPSYRNDEHEAEALLAHLLEWHRREAKPAWWRYFRHKNLTSAELVAERGAIGELRRGDIVENLKKSVVRRFTFPAQEHGFAVGDHVCDPATEKTWVIWGLDDELGTIDLKIGTDNAEPTPLDIVECGPVDTRVLSDRLRDLGERVVREGMRGMDPATALLLRCRPAGHNGSVGPLRRDGESTEEAALRLILGLQDSYLPIQGPPGTGKTYTAARAILALTEAGRRVGITAPSHAVIHNLLDEVIAQATRAGRSLRIGQRADNNNPFLHPRATSMPYPKLVQELQDHELDVAAGTVWMWARQDFRFTVDTLVVDEAGQLSLANVLAVCRSTRNVVLVGDPQQLAQPSQAVHPPGVGVSALGHVLGQRATIPDDAGLFLNTTHRMHPALCEYSSEVFYDGRLHGIAGLEYQKVQGEQAPFTDSGLYVIEVEHEGNTNSSREEADEVVRLIGKLRSCKWTDKNKRVHQMTSSDVLVVTPYNAQIREIEGALARAAINGVRVGTVDKFQGRQAPAVIYSMATSSAEDAPRGMEFLFDLHRLNVATSRARALAIIVASADLPRVFCRTPRQMVLANALCRAWEWETRVQGTDP
jgi:predicted RecB family nuclease